MKTVQKFKNAYERKLNKIGRIPFKGKLMISALWAATAFVFLRFIVVYPDDMSVAMPKAIHGAVVTFVFAFGFACIREVRAFLYASFMTVSQSVRDLKESFREKAGEKN